MDDTCLLSDPHHPSWSWYGGQSAVLSGIGRQKGCKPPEGKTTGRQCSTNMMLYPIDTPNDSRWAACVCVCVCCRYNLGCSFRSHMRDPQPLFLNEQLSSVLFLQLVPLIYSIPLFLPFPVIGSTFQRKNWLSCFSNCVHLFVGKVRRVHNVILQILA